MADEGKKISFGFSKSIKKSGLKILPQPQLKKVDFIECLDEKSIKVVGYVQLLFIILFGTRTDIFKAMFLFCFFRGDEKKDGPLVIPLLGSKTWHDRIVNKTDADIYEPKTKEKENVNTSKITNGNINRDNKSVEMMDVSEIKKEVPDGPENLTKTLEEQAAEEIIEDLKTEQIKAEDPNLAVPVAENKSLKGEIEVYIYVFIN